MKQHPCSKIILFSLLALFFSCTTPGDKSLTSSLPGIYLEEMTIAKLHEGYTTGKYTVKQVVKDYLDRIEAIDRNGPKLNSVIVINPDAMQIAAELDNQMANGKPGGPLFGVPVLLKDNIDTRDRMPNTAGSRALRNSYPLTESQIVRKLREAGAVIIGKTNLSEWANFRSESSSSGWSGIGGQTKNPYVLGGNSSLAAIAGYPSITLPAGFIGDLPAGVSFTGRAWSEPVIIEIAYSFEQATRYRKAPRFLPTD